MIAKNKRTPVPPNIKCQRSYRTGYSNGYKRGYDRGKLKGLLEYRRLKDCATAAKEQLIINHHAEYARLIELAKTDLLDKIFDNIKED